jgi:hypothetical protein
MKHTRHFIPAFLFVLVTATNGMSQQGNVAAGGEATSPGGSMSYSIGQVDYLVYASPQGNVSLGLQQPFIYSLPLVLEIPNTTVSGNDILCFNAEQTVIVAGEGKNFTVEPNGFAEIIAGQNILMKVGTTVESGGNLHAYISTNWCNQPKNLLATFGKETSIAAPFFEKPMQHDFFKVYPNPTSGDFTLELNKTEELFLIVEIYTLQGNLVLRREMPARQQYSFSLIDRQPGLYFIRVQSQQETGISKIIKQ